MLRAATLLALLLISVCAPAEAVAFDDRSRPAVETTGTAVSDNTLETTITVRADAPGNTLSFLLVIPEGKVTSVTLLAEEFSGSADTASGPLYLQESDVPYEVAGYIRGYRLLKIKLPVILPGAADKKLKSGRLKVTFDAAPAVSIPPAGDQHPNGFHRMVEELVANPQDIATFQLPLAQVPSFSETPADPPMGGYPDAVARFTVTRPGPIGFTGADLQASGVDVAQLKPRDISIWANGQLQPVLPSLVSSPGAAILPADQFVVYAGNQDSTYTVSTEYWVRVKATSNPFMEQTTDSKSLADGGSPGGYYMAGTTIETDVPPVLTKNDQFLSILDFRWVWWTWTNSAATSVPLPRKYDTSGTITFGLDGLSTASAAVATAALTFYGHHWTENMPPVTFAVTVNNQPVGQVSVTPANLKHTIAIPAAFLTETSNSLVLTPQAPAVGALPDICFDRLDVTYPRRYLMTSSTLEFSSPGDGSASIQLQGETTSASVSILDITGQQPRIVTSAGQSTGPITFGSGPSRKFVAITPAGVAPATLKPYQVTSNLLSADNQGDVVVIAWPEFMSVMQPWVEHKTQAGHQVRLVSVQDVYDQFGYGNASPHAIRAFLHHAALKWKPGSAGDPASVVLLVGDSTSAYRNEFRNDVINYVPTMRLTGSDDSFASDQWYVSHFGDDPYADALIGRFSVNNVEDLQSIIRKQLHYAANTSPGPWQNTAGFIVDHTEFDTSVQRIMREVVPPRFFKKSVGMDAVHWIDNYYFPREIADARQAKVSQEATGQIRDMFNQGSAVVTYFGHGSPNIWSNERMWFGGDSPNSDNLLLNNLDKLPIVINMTCNSGAIDYPQPRWNICISEDFMRVPNGGAVACFVPSGPGLTVQHERLMTQIGYNLFGSARRPLGESLQLAMWRFLAAGNPPELTQMFILLGDPLLMPNLAAPAGVNSFTQPAATTVTTQMTSYGDNRVRPGRLINHAPGTATTASNVATSFTAVAAASVGTSGVTSLLMPGSALGLIELERWGQEPTSGSGEMCQLGFALRNTGPVAASDVQLTLTDGSGKAIATSDDFALAPFAAQTARISMPCSPGLTPLRVWISDAATSRIELHPDIPLAALGLRPDDRRDDYPAAIIDPASVSVQYRQTDDQILATVSAQLYITAREPLSNLRVALEDSAGNVLPDTEISVPAVAPGSGTRISVATLLTSVTATSAFRLRLDPSGYYPLLKRFPGPQVNIGPTEFPDVAIESVTPDNASPTDGETVFFDVTVKNSGKAPAEALRVTGERLLPDGKREPMDSRISAQQPVQALAPGQSSTIRLRWDPFRNSGDNSLSFAVKSLNGSPDTNLTNNTRPLGLRVRTKADIKSVGVGVVRVTADDVASSQVRFMARVQNAGETTAYGLKVTFYSDPQKAPEHLLGETSIEEVPPGEERQTVLTYKLKPGDETRRIQVTCEVMYRGSRQRVPLH